ncbi:hypothetical protein C2G38_2187128 [Gigaspora rosea]|uniref:Uncharacterized protein n=1 Tax=Gigaspora rosea TaxID=44941 RepID=A0A397VDX4_9GLOM|nr:hypothetical protein C2G38_2187128 [Gigaspora rosea]
MPKAPIYKVPFEIFVNIFDNLDDNLNALHFAQICKYLARSFKLYNYPTPGRDVLISLTTNHIKPKRFYFSRSTIGKRKREPLYIEFDPESLPCKNFEKTVRKKVKKTQKEEYFCNSPFQSNEKLVYVKE